MAGDAESVAPNCTTDGLSKTEEHAALLVAEDELTDEEIADKVGIAKRSLEYWKKRPHFAARVQQHKEAFKDRALSEGFADKRARLKALNTVATVLLQQLGDSQYQHVTFITEDGAHIYGFDVPRLKEFRGALDDIAKEVGDRRQGKDVAVSITDHRKEAEAIAAEIGKADDPAVVAQIEQDLLLSTSVKR